MTIRDNLNLARRASQERSVDHADEDDKFRLHCDIPSGLERRLKMSAVERMPMLQRWWWPSKVTWKPSVGEAVRVCA